MSLHPHLHVLRDEPPIAETPAHALAEPVTPSASVYIRSNFATPSLGEAHRLRVHGAVSLPLAVGLRELHAMESRTIVMTMECAGNDRLGMHPVPDGEPWNHGAISTVAWSGVPLRVLLERARIGNDVVEVVTTGADRGVRPGRQGEIAYARSLPLAVALDDDTLVALAMNGEPLSAVHGAPMRLVVPRWYGMASVKWIESIEAVVEPFAGHFQRERYVYEQHGNTTPVTTMRVKSFIVSPDEGGEVEAGRMTVTGWAWSGDGPITRVEVQAGSGMWHNATVDDAVSKYAWVRWSASIVVESRGVTTLRSRAIDSSGAIQPDVIQWNRLGYGNNAIRQTTIRVV